MTNPADTDNSDQKPHGKLRIEDFMTKDVFTVRPTTTIREAIHLTLEKKVSSLPIVNVNETVVSMVSGLDLMKLAALGAMDKPLLNFMDRLAKPEKVVAAKKHESFTDAFKLFLTHNMRLLVVTDGTGKLHGVVSRSTILKILEENTVKPTSPH